jgi:hypothetical protein
LSILRQDPELRAASWRRPGSAAAGEGIVAESSVAVGPRATAVPRRVAFALIAILVAVGGFGILLRTTALPGPSASPSPSDERTIGEKKLLDQLPRAVAGTCTPESHPEQAVGNAASLWCDLPPVAEADEVWFDRFSPADLAHRTFNDIAAEHDVPGGDCSEATGRAVGLWSIKDVQRDSGGLLCYEADGGVWIVWTYDTDGILARARRGDSDWKGLYVWWRETRRFLR